MCAIIEHNNQAQTAQNDIEVYMTPNVICPTKQNGFYYLITDEGPLHLQKVENITEEEIAANYRLERHYR